MENRKLLREAIFLFINMATLLFVSSCHGNQWLFFHDNEIRGYVIDAETSGAVENAVVVAMWQLSQIASEGFGGYAKVIEVKTDKEGRFMIPSWTAFKPLTANSVLHELAPKIVIFKPGYKVYWSHKRMREGFPGDISMTLDEKKKAKEEYGITPTKLRRIYIDEDIWNNYLEFCSQADFPDKYYSKKQIKTTLDSLKGNVTQLPVENRKSIKKILSDIKEDHEYWLGGKQ